MIKRREFMTGIVGAGLSLMAGDIFAETKNQKANDSSLTTKGSSELNELTKDVAPGDLMLVVSCGFNSQHSTGLLIDIATLFAVDSQQAVIYFEPDDLDDCLFKVMLHRAATMLDNRANKKNCLDLSSVADIFDNVPLFVGNSGETIEEIKAEISKVECRNGGIRLIAVNRNHHEKVVEPNTLYYWKQLSVELRIPLILSAKIEGPYDSTATYDIEQSLQIGQHADKIIVVHQDYEQDEGRFFSAKSDQADYFIVKSKSGESCHFSKKVKNDPVINSFSYWSV